MRLPSAAEWLFALRTFAASMMALYLALRFDLPRPYWAMATVYICSQPFSGATRSKALYRLFGTLVGASFAVLVVPVLVNAPELLVLAVALWTGLCLYLSLLDRTPRSYVFMLSGYTAAMIAFPSVTEPGAVFDTALARSEEIALGILCASLFASLVLPRGIGPVLDARVEAWLSDAGAAVIGVLEDPAREREGMGRRIREVGLRLSGDAVAIDGLSAHLAFDVASGRGRLRWMTLLRQRMLLLLPVVSSLADRLGALREAGALTPEIRAVLAEVAAWLRRGREAPDAEAERLRRVLAAAAPRLDAASPWSDVLLANLLVRLADLVDIRQDCRVLQRHVAKDWGRLREPLAFPAGAAPPRHVDHGMALFSAAGVVAAILIVCAAWILTGWPDGGNAAVMAAVACSFFSSQDDPVPGILTFARWTIVAVVVVAAYVFAVFPAIHDFPVLALALAPFFLVVGLLIARPQAGMTGMILGANGATFLAIQSSFTQDFAAFANSNVATLVGMWSAALLMRLVRSVGADYALRRLAAANRQTIAKAAERRGRGDREEVAALMIDRLGLAAPRLAAARAAEVGSGPDLLAELRVGLNVLDLRRARHRLPPEAVAAVDAVLSRLARHYRSAAPAVPDLLAAIDAALSATAALPAGALPREALLGLVGIRRGLFPDAPTVDPVPQRDAGGARIAA